MTPEALQAIEVHLRQHPRMHLNHDDAVALVDEVRRLRALMEEFVDHDDGDDAEEFAVWLVIMAVKFGLALGRLTPEQVPGQMRPLIDP